MTSLSYELIVPGTLYTLLVLSIVTWTLIALKALQALRFGRRNRAYTQAFWHAPHLQAAADLPVDDGPVARLAQAGLQSLQDTDPSDPSHRDLEHTGDRQDLLERALRQQTQKERRRLEGGLAVLASIGSTSPFIGLFGTVWGIMHALTDIGRNGSASLEVVAGPIGEALIATGIGIAVAVPAVLAYNFFLRRLKLAAADLDDFAADLITLARKSGFRLRRSESGLAVRAIDGAVTEALTRPSTNPTATPVPMHGAYA